MRVNGRLQVRNRHLVGGLVEGRGMAWRLGELGANKKCFLFHNELGRPTEIGVYFEATISV